LPSSLEKFNPCALVYSTFPLVLVLVQFSLFYFSCLEILLVREDNQAYFFIIKAFQFPPKRKKKRKRELIEIAKKLKSLRGCITQLILYLSWKPWNIGGPVLHRTFCYSCLHCHSLVFNFNLTAKIFR
jgi:hypothetical protein